MIRMDGDEGKGVAHFPTSLWWSGNAVCLQASYDATGVYFRQPQSEEPVLQSLMMWGGDRAILWQVAACVWAGLCVCVLLRVHVAVCVSIWVWEAMVDKRMCVYASETLRKRRKLTLCVSCYETMKVEKLWKCVCVCVCVSPRHWAGCAGHQRDSPGCLCPHSEWPHPLVIDCVLSIGGNVQCCQCHCHSHLKQF